MEVVNLLRYVVTTFVNVTVYRPSQQYDNNNKNQHKKGAGGIAQVVKWLLSKHEALSSNCSTTKEKKNKNYSPQLLIEIFGIISK
jgi:hypothetical protein